MRTVLAAVVIFVSGLGSAAAQDRSGWYGGGGLAASISKADLVDGMTPTAAGTIGIRLSPGFSVEAEVTRGLRTLVRNFGTDARMESTQTFGVTTLAVWRSAAPARVRAAGYAGMTFASHEDAWLAAGRRAVTSQQSVGATAGFMVPITIAGPVSVAPDFRFTFGVLRGEPSFAGGAGVRVLWRF